MSLSRDSDVAVYTHDTIPGLLFLLRSDGVHVYSQGRAEMFIAPGDALQLAAAVNEHYTLPASAPVAG